MKALHVLLLLTIILSLSFSAEKCTCTYKCKTDSSGRCEDQDSDGAISYRDMQCVASPPGCLGTCTVSALIPGTGHSGCVFSASALENTVFMVQDICRSVKSLLPPFAVLMFIAAGVVYAGGQFTGAETRARANVWATAMLVGAIIGLIISAVVPPVMNVLSTASLGQDLGSVC